MTRPSAVARPTPTPEEITRERAVPAPRWIVIVWNDPVNGIVLGTRLGVTDETEAEEIDEKDPDAERRIVFAYLGWLLGQFVDVLEAALPDAAEPDGEGPGSP